MISIKSQKSLTRAQIATPFPGLFLLLEGKDMPCIRLARGKFELTNQDSAGGKKSSVLTSRKKSHERLRNQATFFTGDGIKYRRKGIYNFKNHTSLQKMKKK